jgi:hypothetical protein
MTDTIIALALASLIYPFTVFMVAVTGPHNETERREKAKRNRSRP